MRLIRLAVVLTVSFILSMPLVAQAQQAGKVYRIGVAWVGTPASTAPVAALILRGLADVGYAEGRNVILEQRWAEGKPERIPDLTAELVRLKVDVLAAPANAQARPPSG